MNKIIKSQNDQSILDKLSAQRRLYDKAKKLRAIQFILGVVIIVCLSIARLIWNDNEPIEASIVVVTAVALISEPLLESMIDKRKTLAAQIQQRLDNELYGFSWDDCICGIEPSDEVICDSKDDKLTKKMHDWYDVGIGNVEDENLAILLCQRENISYDSGLREWYVSLCAVVACLLVIGVLVLSFVEGWNLMRFLVIGVIPSIPIIQWFITVFQDNSTDKDNLFKLENLVREEIDKVLGGGIVTKKVLQKIQNLLFLHRKTGYLIPSWFYNCKRAKAETRTAYSVSEFVKKYQK